VSGTRDVASAGDLDLDLGRPEPETTLRRSRNPGLDTLRAAAIALVFMYHYMIFVSRTATFGWLSEVGWAGVDLFFVLSGYLIANQLFAGMTGGRHVSLARFYARRALRTLPVFWLVLAAYALFPAALGGRPPPPWWRFLTFTQNFGLQPGTAFSHAWSLCIEEQFYLVLPGVLAAGAWFARGRRRARVHPTRVHGWALMGVLVAVGVAARSVLWLRYGRQADGHADGYMPWIYYATLCRFDEFMPGVAVAMLKNFHRPLWDRLMARGGVLAGIGAAAVAAMLTLAYLYYDIEGYGWGFFMTAFGYSLLALAFALLVAAALSPHATALRWRVPGADRLALWSYSTYLSHKPLAFFISHRLEPLGVSDGTRLAIIALACIAMGGLLYKLVEAPFMALRDRWVPSNFRAEVPAAARAQRLEAVSP
jgi:peptidoglycan/LPS O-acetylase OafA/YrhL